MIIIIFFNIHMFLNKHQFSYYEMKTKIRFSFKAYEA